jgi:hypothetical protein
MIIDEVEAKQKARSPSEVVHLIKGLHLRDYLFPCSFKLLGGQPGTPCFRAGEVSAYKIHSFYLAHDFFH